MSYLLFSNDLSITFVLLILSDELFEYENEALCTVWSGRLAKIWDDLPRLLTQEISNISDSFSKESGVAIWFVRSEIEAGPEKGCFSLTWLKSDIIPTNKLGM